MAEEKKSSNKKVIIILLIVIVLLLAGGVVFLVMNNNKPAEEPGKLNEDGTLPYAANVGVVKDNEDLASKLQEGADNTIPLHFSTIATSSDGKNFKCILGNPNGAKYDIYFDIYTDTDFTEELYISGLVAPGSQLESFTSNKTFPKGTHDVVLVITSVDDDHKTLLVQTSVVLTLVVN